MDGKYVLLLTVILGAYLCLGAGLFLWTEGPNERSAKEETFLLYQEFIGIYKDDFQPMFITSK